MKRRRFLGLAAMAAAGFSLRLRASESPASWTRPFPPFRIAGNLYYVGSEDLAAFLVSTPEGLILINSNLQSSPQQIKKSAEALGFRFADVKILLIGQGHFDHCAGSAEIKRMTGARYEVMDRDVSVVESGGKTDFQYGGERDMWFPPAKVDRVLHDGDTVRLGGSVLTAHLTAGHNKGTTTWTMDVDDHGRTLHAVIIGGPNVNPGYRLVNNKKYPQIAEDFEREFATLEKLPCDLFLGAHGGYFGLQAKYARWKNGDRDAFIDPAGYKAYVADRKRAFEIEWKRQKAGKG